MSSWKLNRRVALKLRSRFACGAPAMADQPGVASDELVIEFFEHHDRLADPDSLSTGLGATRNGHANAIPLSNDRLGVKLLPLCWGRDIGRRRRGKLLEAAWDNLADVMDVDGLLFSVSVGDFEEKVLDSHKENTPEEIRALPRVDFGIDVDELADKSFDVFGIDCNLIPHGAIIP